MRTDKKFCTPLWALLYNIFQAILLVALAPVILIKICLTRKYRQRFFQRTGWGIREKVVRRSGSYPRIWVHALSVGEVSSVHPLVKALRDAFPFGTLIVSTTTATGEAMAADIMKGQADLFLPFPFDLFYSVTRFLDAVHPDLFILIETDFWPTFMWNVNKRKIPCLLVNGRISTNSFGRYKMFDFFWRPLFSCFNLLAMQTKKDAANMIALGVAREKVKVLGNLKYDAGFAYSSPLHKAIIRKDLGVSDQALLWVAGSTHDGEEEIVLSVFVRLFSLFPDLVLVIAPRNIDRAGKIVALAREKGLEVHRRTRPGPDLSQVIVLDTMGELFHLYALSDVTFVGGSLVPEGGHNPLEPAHFAKPVLFGPFMDDFSEISVSLLDAQGAILVKDGELLQQELHRLLLSPAERKRIGENAASLIRQNQGVINNHVQEIKKILEQGRGDGS